MFHGQSGNPILVSETTSWYPRERQSYLVRRDRDRLTLDQAHQNLGSLGNPIMESLGSRNNLVPDARHDQQFLFQLP